MESIGISTGILFVISIFVWLAAWFRRELFMRWLMSAADRKFVKSPQLDVGLVYLMVFLNLAMVAMVAFQVSAPEPVADAAASTPTSWQTLLAQEDGASAPEDAVPSPDAGDDNDGDVSPAPVRKLTPGMQVSQSLSVIAILLIMALTSKTIYGAGMQVWGWGPVLDRKWFPTLRAIVLAFFLLVPPVLLLHEILTILIDYPHATLQQAESYLTNGQWTLLSLLLLNTAFLVPVYEEVFFRSIVQGFAEQIITFSKNWPRWAIGPMRPSVAQWLGVAGAAQVAATAKAPSRSPFNTDWRPIVASSLLFALAHSGQGAAPVSLYFLAMGLGWLYQKTGNLAITIGVHLGLNAWTLGNLLLGAAG